MSLDPLKSVISIVNVDDTSLALPSVNQYRSGQQRVMEQVQKTIRRTKSKSSSTLSPTSKSSLYSGALDTTLDSGILGLSQRKILEVCGVISSRTHL